MNDKSISLLEFDRIRSQVASSALSSEAAAHIAADAPRTGADEVNRLKKAVSQFLDRMHAGGEEPQGSLPDIHALLLKLRVEGAVLELDEAFALGLFLERGRALVEWLLAGYEAPPQTEAGDIFATAGEMPDCRAPLEAIFKILDREGKMRDLPELKDFRRRIQSLRSDLETTLQGYTATEDARRLLQSTLPSQRDGRVVLALKANFRGRIKGIIHEVSATGQTLFVEPEDVVEKNNLILIEERKLAMEIRRILRNLSARLASFLPALLEFHQQTLYLETIRARARYSHDIRGTFADPGPISLNQARHPLLGRHGVPIDLRLFEGQQGLILTGPNTGGKTVSLKTLGLLSMMNQFGLALPAKEGTSLPIFDGIFADIGDEQSLSQSLSTFSAHIVNISAICEIAGNQSLVLLDELGSGTDPQEGSAIAMAILDCLIDKGCRFAITTHHGILKNYGYTRQGVENASVDFDRHTLSPTYRIVMGIPGESRALEIAERNGLSPAIVASARSYLQEERSDVSAMIVALKQKHQDLDAETAWVKEESQRLKEERRRADLRELRLRQEELHAREGGAGRFRLLLEESRKTLENLVRELKEGEVTRDKTLKVKDFIRELEGTAALEAEALAADRQLLAEATARYEQEEPDAGGFLAGKAELRPGIDVLVGAFKRQGRIIREDKKGFWVVEIGSLRMTMKDEELIPIKAQPREMQPQIASLDLAADTHAHLELNLIGMRLEEALETLQRQIDAALLAGLHEFSVVHGKGNGVLQKGVHDFLAGQRHVADYYFSRPELGGFGRTEVILKRD